MVQSSAWSTHLNRMSAEIGSTCFYVSLLRCHCSSTHRDSRFAYFVCPPSSDLCISSQFPRLLVKRSQTKFWILQVLIPCSRLPDYLFAEFTISQHVKSLSDTVYKLTHEHLAKCIFSSPARSSYIHVHARTQVCNFTTVPHLAVFFKLSKL